MMIAALLLATVSGGCEEISRKTIVHRTVARPDGFTHAENHELPADCSPPCRLPKFCDRSSKPPKCVVAVDDHNGTAPAQPHSLQINLTDRGADSGEAPSDDETPPQPY